MADELLYPDEREQFNQLASELGYEEFSYLTDDEVVQVAEQNIALGREPYDMSPYSVPEEEPSFLDTLLDVPGAALSQGQEALGNTITQFQETAKVLPDMSFGERFEASPYPTAIGRGLDAAYGTATSLFGEVAPENLGSVVTSTARDDLARRSEALDLANRPINRAIHSGATSALRYGLAGAAGGNPLMAGLGYLESETGTFAEELEAGKSPAEAAKLAQITAPGQSALEYVGNIPLFGKGVSALGRFAREVVANPLEEGFQEGYDLLIEKYVGEHNVSYEEAKLRVKESMAAGLAGGVITAGTLGTAISLQQKAQDKTNAAIQKEEKAKSYPAPIETLNSKISQENKVELVSPDILERTVGKVTSPQDASYAFEALKKEQSDLRVQRATEGLKKQGVTIEKVYGPKPDFLEQARLKEERATPARDVIRRAEKAKRAGTITFPTEEINQIVEARTETLNEETSKNTPKVLRDFNSDKGAIELSQDFVEVSEGVGERARTLAQKYFTTTGLFPEAVFESKLKAQGYQDMIGEKVGFIASDYTRAIKALPKDQQQQVDLQVREALQGQRPVESFPAEVQLQVTKMRQEIDALSQQLLDEGMVQGDVELKIADQIGVYLNRSYRITDSPAWVKKIKSKAFKGHEIYNNVVGLMRVQNKIQEGESQADYDNRIEGITEALISDLADSRSPFSFLQKTNVLKKNPGILKKKQDVPWQLRALMGEHESGLQNFMITTAKMSNFISSQRFLTEIVQQGEGKHFFKEPKPGFAYKIGATETRKNPNLDSPVLGPIKGFYTSEAIGTSLEELYNPAHVPAALQALYFMNGVAKWNATVGNASTQSRNFISGGFIAARSGNFPTAASASTAFKVTLLDFAPGIARFLDKKGKFDLAKWRKARLEYTRANVVNDTVHAGEMKAVINEALNPNNTLADFNNKIVARAHGLKDIASIYVAKPAKKVFRTANKLYAAGDAFWKIVVYEGEKAKLSKVAKVAKEGGYQEQWSDAEIEQRAIRNTRNYYPSYSTVSKGVKALRQNPFMSSFTAFWSEMIRNTYHLQRDAVVEMRSDNPATRAMGMKKQTALITTGAMAYMVQEGMQYALGFTNEDDEAAREHMAFWDKLSTTVFLGKDGQGNFTFFNSGYIDPTGIFTSSVMAAAEQDNLIDMTLAFGKEFLQPVLSEEIFVKAIDEASSNKDQWGRPIWNDTDSDSERVGSIISHILSPLVPGSVKQAKKVYEGAVGTVSPYGKRREVGKELAALSGLKINKIDTVESLQFKANDYNAAVDEARKRFQKTVYNQGSVSTEAIADAFMKGAEIRQQANQTLEKKIRSSFKLGARPDSVEKTIKAKGLHNKDIKEVMESSQQGHDPYSTFWDRADTKTFRKRVSLIEGRPEQIAQAFEIVKQRLISRRR